MSMTARKRKGRGNGASVSGRLRWRAAWSPGLHKRSAEIWRRTFDLLQRESPEYRNSVDEEFTKESKSHCRELLGAIIAVAAGRADKIGRRSIRFRAHARRMAREASSAAHRFAARLPPRP